MLLEKLTFYTKGQRKRPFRPAALKYWFLFCLFVQEIFVIGAAPFLPFHCLVSPNSFRDPVPIKLTNKSEERKKAKKKKRKGRVREIERPSQPVEVCADNRIGHE